MTVSINVRDIFFAIVSLLSLQVLLILLIQVLRMEVIISTVIVLVMEGV